MNAVADAGSIALVFIETKVLTTMNLDIDTNHIEILIRLILYMVA